MMSEEAGGVGSGDCGLRVVINVALGCSRIIDDQTAERKTKLVVERSRTLIGNLSRMSGAREQVSVGQARSWN